MWRRRAAAIVQRMIEDLWDEEAGVFWALHEEQPIPVLTPFNLYPLWTGQLPDAIRDRLLDHLTNPEAFWGDYALPSVAYNDRPLRSRHHVARAGVGQYQLFLYRSAAADWSGRPGG